MIGFEFGSRLAEVGDGKQKCQTDNKLDQFLGCNKEELGRCCAYHLLGFSFIKVC